MVFNKKFINESSSLKPPFTEKENSFQIFSLSTAPTQYNMNDLIESNRPATIPFPAITQERPIILIYVYL